MTKPSDRFTNEDDLRDALHNYGESYSKVYNMSFPELKKLYNKKISITFYFDALVYNPVKISRLEIKNPMYGDPYNPKNNNYSRIAARYNLSGKIISGWKGIINSFPKRYSDRDIPEELTTYPKQDIKNSTNRVYYATYGVYEETITANKDDDLNEVLISAVRNHFNFDQSENLKLRVLSFDYIVRGIDEPVAPIDMGLGHSELKNEFGDFSEPMKCVPQAHLKHIQIVRKRINEAKWVEIFGKLEGLYTVKELIEKLYVPYDISVILFDTAGNILFKQKADNRLRILVCEITNEHIYGDLPNGPVRQDLLARAFEDSSTIKLETRVLDKKCRYCEKSFKTKTLYNLHKLRYHDDREKLIVDAESLRDYIDNDLEEVVIETNEIYTTIIGDIISKLKIKPYINRSDGKISHIRITQLNVDIYVYTEDDGLTELGRLFNHEYQGETTTSLLKNIWEKNINNYKSTFNKYTDGFFRQEIFPVDCRVQLKNTVDLSNMQLGEEVSLSSTIDENKEVYCHDVKNAYVSILGQYDLPVYSALDFPVRFTPNSINQITTGWYKVEGYHNEIFNRSGWYCDIVVRTGLMLNIIKFDDITAKFLPTYTVSKKSVSNFLRIISDNHPDLLKEVNKLVGYFRNHTTKNETTNITASKGEIAYFKEQKSKLTAILTSDTKHTDYTMITTIREYPKHQITSPIYFYIIQGLYSLLLDLKHQLNDMGCKVIGYKTDSVYFQTNDIKNHKTPINRNKRMTEHNVIQVGEHYVGKFKDAELVDKDQLSFSNIDHRSFPDIFETSGFYNLPESDTIKFDDTLDFDWFISNYIDKNKSVLLSGLPGSGKTTLLEKLSAKFDKDETSYKILAFSNCAASLYENAKTFHRSFGINMDNNSVSQTLIKRIKEYDWLIIDEYSMIPEVIWSYLSLIKKLTNCKMLIAGDHRQLSMIMSENGSLGLENVPDIFKNPVIRDLHDYNMIQMNYSHRIKNKGFLSYLLNTEQYKIKDMSKKFGITNYAGGNTIHDNRKYYIVRFRNTAKRINAECAFGGIPDEDDTRYEQYKEYLDTQQISIEMLNHKHKLICTENHNAFSLIKNKHYIVHSIGQYINYCDDCEGKYEDDGNIPEYDEGLCECLKHPYEGFRIKVDNNIHNEKTSIVLPIDALKYFDFGYAFTIWKAQGCTINKPIHICDWSQLDMTTPLPKYMTRDLQQRIIYTAFTRVEGPHMISVE